MNEWVTSVNGLAANWLSWLWPACWQGSLAVVAVWTVHRVIRRTPPGVRCWLWRSSPHPDCGFNCSEVATKAMRLEEKWYDGDSRRRVKQAKDVLVTAIDRGHPALVCSEETGLVVGYLVDGGEKRLLIRPPYSNKGEGPTLLSECPWGFIVITGGPRIPDRAHLVDSLRLAVRLAHTPHAGDKGAYACGFSAYDSWIADLVDERKVERLKKSSGEAELSNANAHIYYCLIDARRCAAAYLRRIETDLGAKARPHLQRAAEHYDDVAERLDSGRSNVAWSWEVEEGNAWTSEMRASQASLLREAATIEREAIAEIKSALLAETEA